MTQQQMAAGAQKQSCGLEQEEDLVLERKVYRRIAERHNHIDFLGRIEENSVSKQGSDQSPPLGLDPRVSGAGLCGDRLGAQRSVPAFPSQQEVDTRGCHGIEDVSCSRDDQFFSFRQKLDQLISRCLLGVLIVLL